MARNAARRKGWERGSEGTQEKGQGMCNRLHNVEESSASDSARSQPAPEQV